MGERDPEKKQQTILVDVNGTAVHVNVLCQPSMTITGEFKNGAIMLAVWDANEINNCRRMMRGNPEEQSIARKNYKPDMVEQVEREIRAEQGNL